MMPEKNQKKNRIDSDNRQMYGLIRSKAQTLRDILKNLYKKVNDENEETVIVLIQGIDDLRDMIRGYLIEGKPI